MIEKRTGAGLEIDGVSKIFANHREKSELPVLQGVSFQAEAGSFVSVIGESGCGKTTLLRIIAGLEQASEGEVRLDGITVNGPNRRCGMMFQKNILFPWLTVRENIEFGPKLLKRKSDEHTEKLLQMMHLEQFAEVYPDKLSGGMAQRAALARALANEPEVLLLDEPLGALDALTRMKLQDELLRVWNYHGNTVVMVTHDIDEAIYMSDRIIVMSLRPGTIKRVIPVPMAHPRSRISGEFIEIRNAVLENLNFAKEG
ncbi:MAG: ABC transporter ATP-binding protein [Lachnospiraceae bacterium]|nr:ABC transporter ATP-binding protein [Lachnospiraceae bacterium]